MPDHIAGLRPPSTIRSIEDLRPAVQWTYYPPTFDLLDLGELLKTFTYPVKTADLIAGCRKSRRPEIPPMADVLAGADQETFEDRWKVVDFLCNALKTPKPVEIPGADQPHLIEMVNDKPQPR